MTHPSSHIHPRLPGGRAWGGLACAAAGAWLFQFFGNSTRGYIGTSSLFRWWGFQWVNPGSETQHGLLVLAISMGLLVRNLGREPRNATARSPLGLTGAALAGGLLLHSLGFVAEQARLSIVGLLIFAWGLAALMGGARWARASAFPLAFLVFAIPMNALDSAGFWLRMWVVGGSAWITHGLGIHVLVNGTQLLSPDGRYDYDVAAACSGVRSLVALTALSVLVGYLRFRSAWLWAGMAALCFPLVLVGNVVRIVAIVIAAQLGGQAWGDRVHEIMGFAVFAIVLGGIYAAAEAIALRRPQWTGIAAARTSGENLPQVSAAAYWSLVAATLVLTGGAGAFLEHLSTKPSLGRAGIVLTADGSAPAELPTFLGRLWVGEDSEVTAVERQVLPPDTGFSRKLYMSVADESKSVLLSIVLSGHDRTSIHRPELCLVGQGWTILGSASHSFRFPGQGVRFNATVLRVVKTVTTRSDRVVVPQLVVYYFVGGDVVVASHWERILRDAWYRVAHGRADRWAYVLIQTGESDGEEGALSRIQAILDGTLPVFQKAGVPEGNQT